MLLLLTVYSLLLIALSAWFNPKNDEVEFFVAGRSITTTKLMISKFAGAIGVSTFITYTGYAYQFGFGIFALLIGAVFGYSLFAFWAAPMLNQLGAAHRFLSQGDFVTFKTNHQLTGSITNGITAFIQFFWILLGLVGGAKVIAEFNLMTYHGALVFTSVVVLIYILLSGMKAVILTDIIQAVIILFFLGIIVFYIANPLSDSSFLSSPEVNKIKPGQVIGLLLYGSLSVFGMADRFQLSYAAKSPTAARNGMALAILPVLLVAGLLLLTGLYYLSQQAGVDPDLVFLNAMTDQLPQQLTPLLLLLFFAGLMSSADTSVFAVSLHLSELIPSTDQLKTARWVTVFTVILAVLIASFWRSIVEITIVGAAMKLILAVPIIYLLKGGVLPWRYLGSVIGGTVGLLAGLVFFGPEPQLAITVLLGTLVGLVVVRK